MLVNSIAERWDESLLDKLDLICSGITYCLEKARNLSSQLSCFHKSRH